LETVKILVEYEADISKYTESGYTPLMIAADFGRTDLLELLIKNGGKVDDINPKDKNTALHYACKKCNETVIQLLLANNATKNIRNGEGKSAEELLPEEKAIEIKNVIEMNITMEEKRKNDLIKANEDAQKRFEEQLKRKELELKRKKEEERLREL